MFRPRKYVYQLLTFDSIVAAWKTSKLVFCSHVFIMVPKQLLNKLPSKKESRQIGSELSSASRGSGMRLCNTYEPERCKLQVSRVSGVSMSSLPMKQGPEVWLVRISEMFIISATSVPAINTQHITPFNFLFDCYFIRVFCLVFFGVFLFLPGLHRELCFLAEFSECPVKPLVTTFLLQEVPTEPNDKGGKETLTVMWETPSQEKKIKECRHKGPFCQESGTWRPAVSWAGLVHDGNITSLGTQWARLFRSSEARVSHTAVCSGLAVSWAKRLIPDTKLSHHDAGCLYIEVECVACIVPLRQLLKWKGSTAQRNK